MAHLSLTLLGQFQVRLADQLLTSFESDKVRALLCYLAVEPSGVPHSRDTLAALLWPGYNDESARTSLRQTLYHLRKLLGDDRQEAADAAPFLLVTRQTIALNPAAPYQVDVHQLGALVAATAGHDHRTLADCAACRQRLRQAVDLYGGEFLAGFTIADSAPFEEWRRITQEQLHGQALAALTQLAEAAEAALDFPEAQHYAERQLQLEPWREAAHRQIMRVLAQSGQRAAALAHYQRCCQILRTELNVEPDRETTALFEQIRIGTFDKVTSARVTSDAVTELVEVTASLVTLAPPHNLPATLTPFIGRASELAKLLTQLQHPDCRLLTLVGPGGMGKTRLALEVARQRLDNYADGVFFVSLAPLTGVEAVAPTIAATLGLTLTGGDPPTALVKVLASKQLLLILDNFEHLLGAAGLVAALLQRAPRIQILVTSRARLNLQGEYFAMVQPLRFGGALTVAAATNADAVRLFVQSANRSQPDFRLDPNNLPAVLHICQLVEGMPLGLEMAAGWVELLSLAEIAAEIERSVDFLTVEWANAPERQRSMRAVFDWSWRLLTDTEQKVFRQLALFRGGFTREAAEQVAGASLRVLAALVHKSLVRRVENNAVPGSARYDIHELLRQLAEEHLRTSAEHEQVAARHSRFYLAYVAAREARLARQEPREAAVEIQEEIDNIRQAWRCAVQRLDFPALQRSAWALHSFHRHTGSSAEALQAFQLIADCFPALSEPALTQSLAPQQNPAPVSRLVAIYAYLLAIQNKVEQAVVVAARGLAWAQAEDEADAAALCHLSWGQAFRLQGHQAAAQDQFERALQVARTVENAPGKSELLYDVECSATMLLGAFEADWGNNHAARAQMGQGLQLAQTLGKRRMQTTLLINMADIARNMGAYPAARQEYEEAIRLTRQIDFRWGEGVGQLELGDVVRKQGEYSYAAQLMTSAYTLLQEIGEHGKTALALTWLGRLYAYLGDSTAAEAWLTRYQQVTAQVRGWEAEIDYYQARTVLALQCGELAQALAYATQGWQIGQSRSLPDVQAYALIGIGHAQRQVGQLMAAASAYQQALALYTTIQRPDLATEAMAGLAAIAQQQGDQPQALHLADTLLGQLAEQPTVGLDEPFFLYLTCYQILAAAHDPRATALLQQGQRVLQRYADQIISDSLRRSFWENVPIHTALHQAYSHQSAAIVYTNGEYRQPLAAVPVP
ncbi:MAG: hypothetical protein DYG89_41635 [Caldilinea sp. CFX5]|nr:hypothetical protein [Caldilinea sp. CFX5]